MPFCHKENTVYSTICPPSLIGLTCTCSPGLRSCTLPEAISAMRELCEWYWSAQLPICLQHSLQTISRLHSHPLFSVFFQFHCIVGEICQTDQVKPRWPLLWRLPVQNWCFHFLIPAILRTPKAADWQGRLFCNGHCLFLFLLSRKVLVISTAVQKAFYSCVQEALEFLSHWLEQAVCNLIAFRVAAILLHAHTQKLTRVASSIMKSCMHQEKKKKKVCCWY